MTWGIMAWMTTAPVKIHILSQLKKTLHWCSPYQDYHKVSPRYGVYLKYLAFIVQAGEVCDNLHPKLS
jgi:hypothetical protein